MGKAKVAHGDQGREPASASVSHPCNAASRSSRWDLKKEKNRKKKKEKRMNQSILKLFAIESRLSIPVGHPALPLETRPKQVQEPVERLNTWHKTEEADGKSVSVTTRQHNRKPIGPSTHPPVDHTREPSRLEASNGVGGIERSRARVYARRDEASISRRGTLGRSKALPRAILHASSSPDGVGGGGGG